MLSSSQPASQPEPSATNLVQQLWTMLNATKLAVALLTAVRRPNSPPGSGDIVDFQYTLVNDAHAALSAHRPADLPGKYVSDVFPGYQSQPFFPACADAIRTQQPGQLQAHYKPNGLDNWYSVQITPLGDELVVAYTEVTDTHRAEAEISKQAAELRAILDASINSIVALTAIRDTSGQIVDFRMDTANAAVLKSNFMPPDQIIGRRLLTVFPGNRDNGFFDLYVRVVETGEAEQSTQFYRDEFGLEGWFEVSAVKQAPEQVTVTYNNVSGIKKQELDLQRINDRLVQINDSALAAIAAYSAVRETGPDGKPGPILDFVFDSFSRTAEEMTGLKAADVVGQRMLALFPGIKETGLFDKWVNLVETGDSLRFTDYYNEAGIELWYDTKAVKWGDGFIQSYIDVSANVHHLQRLEEANQLLQLANENLQQFAFVASHDLQEPLRKIVTLSDLLMSRYATKLGDGVDLLNRQHRAALRMTALVKDLLSYAQLATPELNREEVALNAVVSEVLNDLEQDIADRQADVLVGTLPSVWADARQVQQLLQNLLSNAIKYVAEGTRPQVRIDSQLRSRTDLHEANPTANFSFTADEYHEITVADNGIGFNPDYRERIFKTFQRLHPVNGSYEGTGIGLAIVKRVAENHRAFVTADSLEGQGATFRVYWPVEH